MGKSTGLMAPFPVELKIPNFAQISIYSFWTDLGGVADKFLPTLEYKGHPNVYASPPRRQETRRLSLHGGGRLIWRRRQASLLSRVYMRNVTLRIEVWRISTFKPQCGVLHCGCSRRVTRLRFIRRNVVLDFLLRYFKNQKSMVSDKPVISLSVPFELNSRKMDSKIIIFM